jgi:hypothetical protein
MATPAKVQAVQVFGRKVLVPLMRNRREDARVIAIQERV